MDDALNGPVLDLPGELQSYCHFPSVLHFLNMIIPGFFCRLQEVRILGGICATGSRPFDRLGGY